MDVRSNPTITPLKRALPAGDARCIAPRYLDPNVSPAPSSGPPQQGPVTVRYVPGGHKGPPTARRDDTGRTRQVPANTEPPRQLAASDDLMFAEPTMRVCVANEIPVRGTRAER
jgi:hypothetical protein